MRVERTARLLSLGLELLDSPEKGREDARALGAGMGTGLVMLGNNSLAAEKCLWRCDKAKLWR